MKIGQNFVINFSGGKEKTKPSLRLREKDEGKPLNNLLVI